MFKGVCLLQAPFLCLQQVIGGYAYFILFEKPLHMIYITFVVLSERWPTMFIRSFLFAVVLLSGVKGAYAQTANASEETIQKLVMEGGYVIYMRHSITERNTADVNLSDLDDCSQQRNLSDEGRAQAARIAAVIKKRKLPVSEVFSSPLCRAKHTAEIIFGTSVLKENLAFSMGADSQETQKKSQWLKDMLAKPVDGYGNRVIVGHTSNLKEAVGIWPKPEGVSHIFKADGQGGVDHIGMILPDEWQ